MIIGAATMITYETLSYRSIVINYLCCLYQETLSGMTKAIASNVVNEANNVVNEDQTLI